MGRQDENAVLRSQDYFRLKQEVASPGDIYELDISTTAIYIGPDSDISEVQVTYFNPNEPNALETAVVAVNGPFVGRLDSLLKTRVPTTGQPARLLVSPVDYVDNAYAPPLSVAERRFNIPAVIDLMAAVKILPDIPAVRADRTLRLPMVPFTTGKSVPPDEDDGSTDIVIPIYGRRMVTVAATASVDVGIRGSLVNLQPGGTSTIPRDLFDLVIPSTVPPSLFTAAEVIRANDAARQGNTYLADGTPSGYYEESDQSEGPFFTNGPFPKPRGMADLLLLNIRDASGLPGVNTRFVDLFIKLSDRES